MVRGVPWDDLRHESNGAPAAPQPPLVNHVEETRGARSDVEKIARNIAAGGTIGAFCGTIFGVADVLMDLKSMTAGQRNPATAKVVRHATAMGVFMSSFYGVRKALDLYNYTVPTGVDRKGFNDVSAAAVSFLPLALYPPFRRYLPYSMAMLVFDFLSDAK